MGLNVQIKYLLKSQHFESLGIHYALQHGWSKIDIAKFILLHRPIEKVEEDKKESGYSIFSIHFYVLDVSIKIRIGDRRMNYWELSADIKLLGNWHNFKYEVYGVRKEDEALCRLINIIAQKIE